MLAVTLQDVFDLRRIVPKISYADLASLKRIVEIGHALATELHSFSGE